MDEDRALDPAEPRDAASVILVRERAGTGEAEVFLLRRHARSAFMARSFVFPGGVVEPEDRDLRQTAARELFEEAGVLLTHQPKSRDTLSEWRRRLAAGGSFHALLTTTGLELALEELILFAHWITPSVESRRYSARFFIAALPTGQSPSFDRVETVDALWITPTEALRTTGDLQLPPPQVRIFHDLAEVASDGPSAVLEMARERSLHCHPILPRVVPTGGVAGGLAVLLPWDPGYAAAPGDGLEMAADHPLARGPSRIILGEDGWRLAQPSASKGDG
jgi:8-oxo-dGTP pyrophosphatase MutT (NUDIX family)